MCGIAGILNFRETDIVSRGDVKRMCSALVHRGPDEEGLYTERFLGIGVRRLSIIDIAGGSQPIYSEDKTVYVICNGEIYNFKSLREKLIQKGHIFKTKTDTEVIVHLYEEYGTNCVAFLRGMFAFAVWDSTRKSLLLARDRMGQKPVYYYKDDEQFIFASEIKAILTCAGINKKIDYSAVDDYLHFGFVPSPKSIYKHIRKLPAAHWVKIEGGRVLASQRYWETPWPSPIRRSEKHYFAELNSKLEDSVRLRLASDVPIGAFLSGGVDSSVIVEAMCNVAENTVKTYNVGFFEKTFDESRRAQQIAELFKTDHHNRVLGYDINALFPKVIEQFDEPFSDASALPTYLLSKYTRENITVALSGDGGDELFGGYMRYLARRLMKTYFRVPKSLRLIFEKLIMKLPDRNDYHMENIFKQLKLFAKLAKNIEQQNDYLIPYIFTKNEHHEILSPDFTSYESSLDNSPIDEFTRKYSSLDEVTRMMWLDMNTYLSDDILTKVDRMSMAHSLEIRCPFLDHKLIEFIATIPTDLKINGIKTKYLLKKYAAQRMPLSIINQTKHGFTFPLGGWFKTTLKPVLKDIFFNNDNIYFLNPPVIHNLLEEHWSGRFDHSRRIWNVLVLVVWNLQQERIL